MNTFDDFDTQITPEELKWEEEFLEFYYSQLAPPPSPWKIYEVDCDDGTHGDRIWEWVGYPDI